MNGEQDEKIVSSLASNKQNQEYKAESLLCNQSTDNFQEILSDIRFESDSPSLHDLLRLVQVQQSRINKLNQELSKKSQMVPKSQYEKVLNELEVF